MPVSRNALCIFYGMIAVLALVGTWGNNIQYVGLGLVGTNVAFWGDTLANPASRSVTVDLFFLVSAIAVWMVLEARRLRMRGVWLYVLFGAAIAISVTFPLFMIHRERVLAKGAPRDAAGALGTMDVVGLALVTAVTVAYAVVALRT